jgi:hypothetical protein
MLDKLNAPHRRHQVARVDVLALGRWMVNIIRIGQASAIGRGRFTGACRSTWLYRRRAP